MTGKRISVSNYLKDEVELIEIEDKEFEVYPVYYPVGRGRMNIDKTIRRVRDLALGS